MINKPVCVLMLSLFLSVTQAEEKKTILVQGEQVQMTKQQFMQALARMDKKTQFQFLHKEDRVFKAVKNFYITQVAVAQAKQSGLYKTPKMQALIDKAIGDTVIQEMYHVYLAEALAKKQFEGLAKAYYQANKERYQTAPEVDVTHILIDTKKHSQKEAKALAEEVRQKALAGDDFSALATQYSDDPSVINNKGRLGFFVKEKMVKPFADAAFSLKNIGDISPIITSNFGLHIIRLEGIKPAGIKPFSQVKEKLITELKNKETVKINQRFKEELLDIDHIKINRAAIRELVTHY